MLNLSSIIAFFTLFFLFAALVFLFAGRPIVMHLPTITHLYRARYQLQGIPLSCAIAEGTTLLQLCRLLLMHVAHLDPTSTVYKEFAHRSLGDIIQIIQYRDRTLRRIIHELRTYASLVSMLGVIGFLKDLPQSEFTLSLSALWNILWKAASDHPFHVLSLFEFIMLVLFAFRLWVELQAIRDLLEED